MKIILSEIKTYSFQFFLFFLFFTKQIFFLLNIIITLRMSFLFLFYKYNFM